MSWFQSSSFSTVSYSVSTTTSNGDSKTASGRYAQQTMSDNSGTTVKTASQKQGGPVRLEQRDYDSRGRRLEAAPTEIEARIEDVTEKEEKARRDREYEERIEDEYAKREGGA